MGINGQQGGDSLGAKANLEPCNNSPAGLFFSGVFTIAPKAEQ
jgi:hypothetical protein